MSLKQSLNLASYRPLLVAAFFEINVLGTEEIASAQVLMIRFKKIMALFGSPSTKV